MVRSVINLVYREVRGLHQAAYVLALFAFGSQILAIVRDRLLAHAFGAGTELDIYYTAFRIPDLLFVLFASMLSIYVLLPFVQRKNEQENAAAGAAVIAQVFTLFLIFYTIFAAVLAFAAPLYIPHLFPGITNVSLLVVMTQILLLQPLFLGLSSLCGVVTQMNNRFVLYAISPLLYNIGIIIGIVALYPIFGLLGLAFGVVLGALGHLLVQVPFVLKSEHRFSVMFNFDKDLLRSIFAVAIPRALTLSTNQIVFLVLVSLATVMTAGSVSVFQFAYNLQSVPLAIIGMSYSVAAFPTLSLLFAKKDQGGFNLQLLTALRHIIFWSTPLVALIVVLRAQIVRVLLGSGSFDWSDTRLTAAVLALFVISLVAQAILLLLVRAFYACGRTVTPLIVVGASGIVTICLAFFFRAQYETSVVMQEFFSNMLRINDVAGVEVLVLVLAFVCGQFLQLILLLGISQRVFSISYKPLVRLLLQSCAASFVGGLAAYITLDFVVAGVNQDTFIGITLQGATSGMVGLGMTVAMYHLFRSPELYEALRSFHSKLLKTDVVASQQDPR